MLLSVKRPAWVAILSVFFFTIWIFLRPNTFHNGYRHVLEQLGPWEDTARLSETHSVIRSASTVDGKYFLLDLMGQPAMNPNIIPHPVLNNVWIIVAQLRQDTQYFSELVCNAEFVGDTLRCTAEPSRLPILPTIGDKCTGDLSYINLNQGPHDARVFYGPQKPYTVYGSNSQYTCFGQWAHDFRNLVEWGSDGDVSPDEFASATELQRPLPWNPIEKNWFIFWDVNGEMYVHYDLFPHRVFAKVDASGQVGQNLGSITEASDEACMKKYMPELGPELESIHQATNSLSITMCKRGDKECTPGISNTFIFTIFQHKKYFNFHAIYEPYILVTEQVPPFKIRAISKRPFWVLGRKMSPHVSRDKAANGSAERRRRSDSSNEEMIYITSMGWKSRDQKYHGYADDILFITFGIEDEATAAIDIIADDLLRDLAYCSSFF